MQFNLNSMYLRNSWAVVESLQISFKKMRSLDDTNNDSPLFESHFMAFFPFGLIQINQICPSPLLINMEKYAKLFILSKTFECQKGRGETCFLSGKTTCHKTQSENATQWRFPNGEHAAGLRVQCKLPLAAEILLLISTQWSLILGKELDFESHTQFVESFAWRVVRLTVSGYEVN